MSGTDPIPYYSTRGTVYYLPTDPQIQGAIFPTPPCRPRARRPHSIHITRLPAGFIPFDLRPQPTPKPKRDSRFRVELRKLASRETAKKVFGTVFPPFSNSNSSNNSSASTSAANSTRATSPETILAPESRLSIASEDSNSLLARRRAASTSSGVARPVMPGQSIVGQPAVEWNDVISAPLMPATNGIEMEKPVCSGNGIACYIQLAEPVIYLTGLDHDGTTRDSPSSSSAILRGKLQLNVTKSAKIKSVTLKFTGRARTEWPEGIPPTRTETSEESSLRTSFHPFFNATYEGSETGYGTLCNYAFRDKSASSSVIDLSTTPQQSVFSLPLGNALSRANKSNALSKEQKRLSLQSNQSRSFQKSDSPYGPTPQQKGYKVFHPGVYEYSFELPIDNNSPETMKLPMASVTWMLEAIVERAGTFRPNLQGFKEVPVVRSPSEDSLELIEPISISREWDNQMHYEIMISGKSFPLGSKIPIAFKLTPLTKVQVHKIKVSVTENIEYFTNNKKVTRKEIPKKLLLLEKVAGKQLSKDYASSEVRVLNGGEIDPAERDRRRESMARRRSVPDPVENLLGDLNLGDEQYWGQTEMEMNVQLPTCEMMEKDRHKRLVPDCTWKCVSVHHWIKIVMRISKVDPDDVYKRRHFEISIDSPFTILSCRATQANLSLPVYEGLNTGAQEHQRACGCPNAARSNVSPASSFAMDRTLDNMPAGDQSTVEGLPRPQPAHLNNNDVVSRPMHLLRQPSFNPPAFSDTSEDPPPPITPLVMPEPPPGYDTVFTPSTDGLQDYFTRYNHEYEDIDEEDEDRAFSRGRVNVAHPRTPGGRIARSMDIQREFMLNDAGLNSIMNLRSIQTPGEASNAT